MSLTLVPRSGFALLRRRVVSISRKPLTYCHCRRYAILPRTRAYQSVHWLPDSYGFLPVAAQSCRIWLPARRDCRGTAGANRLLIAAEELSTGGGRERMLGCS